MMSNTNFGIYPTSQLQLVISQVYVLLRSRDTVIGITTMMETSCNQSSHQNWLPPR